MIGVRHPDGRQLSGSMKTGMVASRPFVVIGSPAFVGMQRRRHHVTPLAPARNLVVKRSRQASMQEVGILWLV